MLRYACYTVLFLVLTRAGAAAIRGNPVTAVLVAALAAAVMLLPLVALVEAVRWFLRRVTAARRDAAP
jgi:hypothetical protein